MADRISPERRSAVMAQVRHKDTSPELIVRRLLHRLGYRYRLHGKQLPGKPDLVFAGRRKVIFVHGCFWHQHEDEHCTRRRRPTSNTAYWEGKLDRNVSRDKAAVEQLTAAGWQSLIVWECEMKDQTALADRLSSFLGPSNVQR